MRGRGWAVYFLGLLGLVALLADVLANDRPVIAGTADGWTMPLLNDGPGVTDWKEDSAEWSLWPPISFSAAKIDFSERALSPPGAIGSNGHRHWLGTDRLGRDTAAGLIAGTRIAVLVGLGSLAIALVIGIPLGAVAGFFGDDGLALKRYTLYAIVVGGLGGSLYTAASLTATGLGPFILLMAGALTTVSLVCICWILLKLASRFIVPLRLSVPVAVDRLILFLLEMTVSIPRLVLLIGLLSFAYRPSLWTVVLVIGLLGWTPVARFLRGELLRIRELPYIDAARVSGLGEARIVLRHALPNAIGPVAVVAAFMVGGSILAEAMLSFLGLGVPAEQVTWGSLLQQSRANPGAWWLAVFPGLLLTVTVLACNSLRLSSPPAPLRRRGEKH